MSGIDQQGNVILPSGAVYNPQTAVQDTLSNIYGMSQGIPYIPMPQYEVSPEFGVSRFLAGDQAMPLVYDVSAPQYTPDYESFVYTPQDFSSFKSAYDKSLKPAKKSRPSPVYSDGGFSFGISDPNAG